MFESWRTDIGETSSGDLRNRVDVDARNNFWNCAISKTAHPPQHGIKRTLSKNLLLDGFEGANFQLPFYNEKGREKSNRKRRSERCVAVKSAIPNFDRNMPLYVIQCRVPRVSMSRISPTFLCIARRKEGAAVRSRFIELLATYPSRTRYPFDTISRKDYPTSSWEEREEISWLGNYFILAERDRFLRIPVSWNNLSRDGWYIQRIEFYGTIYFWDRFSSSRTDYSIDGAAFDELNASRMDKMDFSKGIISRNFSRLGENSWIQARRTCPKPGEILRINISRLNPLWNVENNLIAREEERNKAKPRFSSGGKTDFPGHSFASKLW